MELLREELQAAADLRDLLLAVVDPAVGRGHQLQIVDDDQTQSAASRGQATRPCPDVDDRDVAGVDDRQRRLVQVLRRADDVLPILGADALVADAIPGDAGLAAQQAHADLPPRHLQREDRRRGVRVDRHVAREVRHERGLAHAGTSGHDDQVAGLQTGQQGVEIAEPRRDPRELLLTVLDRLEVDHRLVDQVAHVGDLILVLAAGDVVDPLLRLVGDALGIVGAGVAELHDVGRGGDQPAQQRRLGHDLRVVTRARRGRHLVDEVTDVQGTADGLEIAAALQLLGHGDHVDGVAVGVDPPDRVVDRAMGGSVEVVGVELLDGVGDRVGRQHHRAEHRLLGLDVLGRHPLGAQTGDLVSGPRHAHSPLFSSVPSPVTA